MTLPQRQESHIGGLITGRASELADRVIMPSHSDPKGRVGHYTGGQHTWAH